MNRIGQTVRPLRDRLRAWLEAIRIDPDDTLQAPHQPLLGPEEIRRLALQAGLLAAGPRQREVHDHHAGDWPSAWLGRGLDYEESRPYAPGDDIRDMDWRTTARADRPYLKIYREERQPMLHLVVDRGASLRFGTRRRLKAAQAARVAILLAFAAARRNAAVGGTLWDDTDLDLPPRHGRGGALALADAAATACPPPEELRRTAPLQDLDRLIRLDSGLPRGARLVLISDYSWLTPIHEPVLARLAERLDMLAVQILDPAERALPDVGKARFHDLAMARQVQVDTGRGAVRQAHGDAFRRHHQAQADALARAGVAHLVIGGEVDDLSALLAPHA